MSIEITTANQVKKAVEAKPAPEAAKHEEAVSADESQEIAEESDVSEEAEEAEVEEESEQSEDLDEADPKPKEGEKPKKKNGFQKRVEKLSGRAKAAEEERDYWKEKALKGSTEEPKKVEKTESKDDAEPQPHSFETHAEYVKALGSWQYRQDKKADEKERAEQKAKGQFKELADKHSVRVEAFQKKTPDFEDAIAEINDIPLAGAFQEAIVTSDLGPEVMYELSKNRPELERINKLGPIAIAREIGKIEARLAKPEEKPKPKQSNAPEPISTVKAKGTTAVKKIDDPNLSQQEYEAIRRKQMAAKKAGKG